MCFRLKVRRIHCAFHNAVTFPSSFQNCTTTSHRKKKHRSYFTNEINSCMRRLEQIHSPHDMIPLWLKYLSKFFWHFFFSEGCFSTLSSYAHKIRIIFAFEDTLILSLCMEHALSQTLAYFSSQISGVRHWHDKLSFLSHVFSSEVSGKLTLHGHFITGKENFSIHSSKFTNLFEQTVQHFSTRIYVIITS